LCFHFLTPRLLHLHPLSLVPTQATHRAGWQHPSALLPRSLQSADGGTTTTTTRRGLLFGARRARLGAALHRRVAATDWHAWLVGADMALIAAMPVLVHLSKDPASGRYPYHPAAVNLLIEAAKTGVAAASLAWAGRRARQPRRVEGGADPACPSLVARAARARALAVPALLYAANGYLKFALQAHFSPTAARVLGSLKVVAIALLLRMLTGRRYSTIQVQALALMAVGVAAHGLSGGGRITAAAGVAAPGAATTPRPSPTPTPAVALTVVAAILVPSLASVLSEVGMKADSGSAVQEQTFWLCAFGLAWNGLLAVAGRAWGGLGAPGAPGSAAAASASPTPTPPSHLFAGTASAPVIALVAVSACQGVLSGVFYKHVDAVAKKLSSVGATALTALLSFALLGHASLTPSLGVAALILGIATHQFYAGGDRVGGSGAAAVAPCGACGGSGRATKKGGAAAAVSGGVLLTAVGGSPARVGLVGGLDLLEDTPVKLRRLAGVA